MDAVHKRPKENVEITKAISRIKKKGIVRITCGNRWQPHQHKMVQHCCESTDKNQTTRSSSFVKAATPLIPIRVSEVTSFHAELSTCEVDGIDFEAVDVAAMPWLNAVWLFQVA
ncbi:MAG: hypothetical protein ACKO2L_02105 [Planctomycetaceae bacterium]